MSRFRTVSGRALARRPLAWVCLAFSLAVTLCVYVLAGWQMLLLMAGALFVGLACCLRQHVLSAGIFLALALGFMLGWLCHYEIKDLELNWAGETKKLSMTAQDYPEETEYGYGLEVVVCTEGELEDQRLILWLDELPTAIKPGDLLKGEVTLRSARETDEKWKLSSYSEQVFLCGSCDELDVTARQTPWYLTPRVWAKQMRDHLRELLPSENAGFLISLSLGDKSVLSDELYSDLTRTGLSHIAAASGLHVHMICYILFLLPGDRRRKGILLIPLLVAYAAVVGFTPSISRAVLMQSLLLLAPALQRETDGLTSLSLALAFILLQNPVAIANVGLQLSFAAMLGISLFLPKLARWSGRWGRLEGVKKSLLMTISANMLTLPLVLYYFECVSVLSLLSNLLVVWLLPVLLPLALLCGSTGWDLLTPVLEGLTGMVITLIQTLADIPWAVLTTDHKRFVWWLTFCYLMGIIAFRRQWRRKGVLAAIAASFLTLALCFWSVRWEYDSSRLTFTMLDVGQGQCLLLTTPEETAVIDCGSQNEDSWEILDRELSLSGRETVDLLFLTHYDSDHMNGAARLLEERQVKKLILPVPTAEEHIKLNQLMLSAKGQGTEVYFVHETTKLMMGETSLTFFVTHSEEETGLALLATLEDWDVLVMGDADLSAEERLVREEDLPKIEVLAAGHHGSANATGEVLLRAVTPEQVLISVGENSYGHPTEEMLERCEKAGAEVARTDQKGTLSVGIE